MVPIGDVEKSAVPYQRRAEQRGWVKTLIYASAFPEPFAGLSDAHKKCRHPLRGVSDIGTPSSSGSPPPYNCTGSPPVIPISTVPRRSDG